jgi:hypothetical protein
VNKGAEEYLRDDGYDTQLMYAAGLDFGACYLHSLNPMKDFTYFTTAQAPAPYTNVIEGFTTMGEFCVGASLGLAMTRSFLNGKSNGMAPHDLCQARVCGTDVCGNPCGTCAANETCNAAGACVMPPPPDAGVPDAGAPVDDAGVDAGTVDAGTVDAGTMDAGTIDAGPSGGGAGGGGGSMSTGGGTAATGGSTGTGGGGELAQPPGCGCTTLDVPLALLFLGALVRRRPNRRHQNG